MKRLTMLTSNGVSGRYHGIRVVFGVERYRVKLAGGKWGYFNPAETTVVQPYARPDLRKRPSLAAVEAAKFGLSAAEYLEAMKTCR
jgi:hypothetical protein